MLVETIKKILNESNEPNIAVWCKDNEKNEESIFILNDIDKKVLVDYGHLEIVDYESNFGLDSLHDHAPTLEGIYDLYKSICDEKERKNEMLKNFVEMGIKLFGVEETNEELKNWAEKVNEWAHGNSYDVDEVRAIFEGCCSDQIKTLDFIKNEYYLYFLGKDIWFENEAYEELGYQLTDDVINDIPAWAKDYFDYTRYGRDFTLNANGYLTKDLSYFVEIL